ADGGHVRGERPGQTVERDDLLSRLGPAYDHRRAVQLRQIERVQRLVQLEQDVVRGVDHVVDGALPDRSQPAGKPSRARRDLDAANHGDHVAGRALRVLEANLYAVDDSARRGGRTAPAGGHAGLGGRRRPTAATAGGTARAAEGGVPAGPSGAASRSWNGRQLNRPAQDGRQLAGDALVAQQI